MERSLSVGAGRNEGKPLLSLDPEAHPGKIFRADDRNLTLFGEAGSALREPVFFEHQDLENE